MEGGHIAIEHVARRVAVIHETDLVADAVGQVRCAAFRLIKRLVATLFLFDFLAMGPAAVDPPSPIFIGAGAAIALIAGEALQKPRPDRNRSYIALGGG